MTELEIFRQKAHHYQLCFVSECPLKTTCLHWLVGQQLESNELTINCINPMHPSIRSNQCILYRKNHIARYAKGMMHFFDDMPHLKETRIRGRLISAYGRRQFYEFRNGVKLISPEMQDFISKVCQDENWNEEPHYDEWTEDYLW